MAAAVAYEWNPMVQQAPPTTPVEEDTSPSVSDAPRGTEVVPYTPPEDDEPAEVEVDPNQAPLCVDLDPVHAFFNGTWGFFAEFENVNWITMEYHGRRFNSKFVLAQEVMDIDNPQLLSDQLSHMPYLMSDVHTTAGKEAIKLKLKGRPMNARLFDSITVGIPPTATRLLAWCKARGQEQQKLIDANLHRLWPTLPEDADMPLNDEKGYSLYKPFFQIIPAKDDEPEKYSVTFYMRVQDKAAEGKRAAKYRTTIYTPVSAEQINNPDTYVEMPYNDFTKGCKVYVILGSESVRQHPSKHRAKLFTEVCQIVAIPPKMVAELQRGTALSSSLPFANRSSAQFKRKEAITAPSSEAETTFVPPPTAATALEPAAKRARVEPTAHKGRSTHNKSKFEQNF
jgi:hypothetical protein